MPTASELSNYALTVIKSWWIIVPVVVSVVRLYEWFVRHGKPLPLLSPRIRWYIALAGIVVAQFVAYRQLQTDSTAQKNSLIAERDQLKQDKAASEASAKEKDRQIKELTDKLNAVPPRAAAPATPVEPPRLTGLRFTQRRVPSDNAETPYGLEIVIQTDTAIQPVAIVIDCDGEIAQGRAGMGAGAYMKTKYAIQGLNRRSYLLSWESPPFAPSTPITATLFSRGAINAVAVRRVDYAWP